MPNNIILLFGMPRSGTTWIGKIFDSHRDTFYRHEPDSILRLDQILPLFPTEEYETPDELIHEYLSKILRMQEPKVCSKLPVFPKSYLNTLQLYQYKAGIIANKLHSKINSNAVVHGSPVKPPRESWLVWKSIESLGRLPILHTTLKNTSSVQIIRHPCGFVASVLRGEENLLFSDKTPSANDRNYFEILSLTGQAQRRGLSIERFMSLHPIERLAWKWLISNEVALEAMDGKENFQVLNYDKMCAHPVETMTKVINEIGLGICPQTESFINASTSKESSSYYAVTKDPLKSAQKWRKELSKDQIGMVKTVVEQSKLLYSMFEF